MGRRLDNSDRGVLISVESARRISDVVRKIEGGDRNIPAPGIRTAFDDGDPVRIGKTTAEWAKGTTATITLWEEGSANSEEQGGGQLEDCVNKFADVEYDKWVSLARGPFGAWYLIAAEC